MPPTLQAPRPATAILSLGPDVYDPVAAADFPAAVLRFRNDRAAAEVGLAGLDDAAWLRHFARFEALPGSLETPLALRYHGHQFRVYNPDIGDGRGFLFAQLRDADGRLMDLGTKGSGPTPWSRFGDGRLTLKGGLREVLATEMLEALGVDTSRSFSLIETGEALERGDEPSPTRSAVLVRLSHGHIRIGTFQRLAYLRDDAGLRRLTDYTLRELLREAPGAEPAVRLLDAVVARTARLAAQYMAAGFVHGVLNSDNINVTGESFDYGPWRFAPTWDPTFTAAYFDHAGLYAFGRQPEAIHWDAMQLAVALRPISEAEPLIAVLDTFAPRFEAALADAVAWRLGVQGGAALAQAVERALRRPAWGSTGSSSMGSGHAPRQLWRALGGGPRRARRLPSRATRIHPYWSGAPCSMLIDEVEAIWAAIDTDDDWAPFHAKVAAVRAMGEALAGWKTGIDYAKPAASLRPVRNEGSDPHAMADELISFEPATGVELWRGAIGDVDAEVAAARGAWADWAARPLTNRVETMRRFANIVRQRSDAFTDTIARETGKPVWEARTEVDSVISKVDISATAYADRSAQRRLDASMGARMALRHKPHGVLAVLGPYNFPAHLPNGHIVPALIAGNAVVFKPSEKTPASGALLVDCLKAAGVPDGCIRLLVGGPAEGRALASHADIDGLLFTGSARTGLALNRAFADRPEKILALEMGGNNPIVVWDTPEIYTAAVLVAQSAFATAGQRCTAARRLIVEDRLYEPLIDTLNALVGRLIVGAPHDSPAPFMGPVIDNDTADQLTESFLDLMMRGGRPIRHLARTADDRPFLAPALIDMTNVAERPDVELFGPILQVVRVSDFDAAIAEANATRYGLSASLVSQTPALYNRFWANIRAGIVNWNKPTNGASSSAPFGGIGWSGNHRPSAYYAADYCAYPVVSSESEAARASIGIGLMDG